MCLIKPYNWYGGKIRMVRILRPLIPEHQIWLEPFMGSAALTLNHARSEREIINDMAEELVCFMRTLQDREKGKELIDLLLEQEYKRETFEKAMEHKKNGYACLSQVEKAVQVYIQITMSFNAIGQSFSEKKGDTCKFRRTVLIQLPDVQERLQGVEIRQGDALDVIKEFKEDSSAFFFLDPPYRQKLRGKGAGKVYPAEMPDDLQTKLLCTIRDAKCKMMLCGYREETEDLYDKFLLPYGWKCYKLMDVVKSCQVKSKKDKAQEYIWVNYELPDVAKYVINTKRYFDTYKTA